MSEIEPVRLERPGDKVVEVVLSDQTPGNAIDHRWADAFGSAVGGIGEDTRAVVLRAEGRNFCVGGNVAGFGAADNPGAHVRSLADKLHQGLRMLEDVEVPVLAAVQGWAAGAGMSLALAADLLVIGTGTRMRTAYNALGLTADGGMTWHLARRVPQAIASDLLLTDRALDADELAGLGVASRVVPDGDLLAATRELATEIAGRSRPASVTVKRLLRAARSADLSEHLDAEAAAIERAADRPDGREGVAAFLAKRPPAFG